MAFKLPSLSLPQLSLFRKKSCLAVDVGTSAVKICKLSGGGGRYKVDLWDSMPMPPGLSGKDFETKGAEILRSLVTRHKLAKQPTIFALPAQAVVIRYLTFQGVPKERLEGIVRHEAEGHIPFPLAEVTLDWCEARKKENGFEVLLVAIKTDKLNSTVAIIEDAGLELQVVDVTTLALFSMYYHTDLKGEKEEDLSEVFVDIGAGTTDIAFLKNQRVFFTRSVPVAGRSFTEIIAKRMEVPEDKAEELKIKHAEVKAMATEMTALESQTKAAGGGLGMAKAPGAALPGMKAPGLAAPKAPGLAAPSAGGLAPPKSPAPPAAGGLMPPKAPGLTPPSAGGLKPPSAPGPVEAGKDIPKKVTEVPLPTPPLMQPPAISLPKPPSAATLPAPASPTAGIGAPKLPAAPVPPTPAAPPMASGTPKPPALSLPKPPGTTAPPSPGASPAAPPAGLGAPKPPTLSLPKPPGAPKPPAPPTQEPDGKSLGAAKAEDGEVFSLFESKGEDAAVDKDKLSAAVKPLADRLVTELRRSFDYFSGQLSGGEIKRITLSGGGASLKGLAEYISTQLNVPTVLFNPLKKVQVSESKEAAGNAQTFSAVIGMGMRMLDGTPLDIDLLPENISAIRRMRSMGEDIKYFAVAAVLFIALVGVYAFMTVNNTETLYKKIQSDIQELDPVVSKTRQLETDQKKVQDLEKSIAALVGARANWIAVLTALDRTLPENASVVALSMPSKERMTLQLAAPSLTDIPDIGRRFLSADFTKNLFTLTNRPNPQESPTATGGKIFQVSFELQVNHAAATAPAKAPGT